MKSKLQMIADNGPDMRGRSSLPAWRLRGVGPQMTTCLIGDATGVSGAT